MRFQTERPASWQACIACGNEVVETDPHLSPDGSWIAFTATIGANTDVYVMPAEGGDPVRLTFNPGIDATHD